MYFFSFIAFGSISLMNNNNNHLKRKARYDLALVTNLQLARKIYKAMIFQS